MKDLFARPSTDNKSAVLVNVDLGGYDVAERLLELGSLVLSAGLVVVGQLLTKRSHLDAKLFLGKGKTQELLALCQAVEAGIVVFNHDLSPSQQRNLERSLGVYVLDRTALILHIFAQRARSHAGKLQVELARLEHLSTRLTRGWTHLERQKGGIGMRGGPGETQLELDRRILRVEVKRVREKIAKLKVQRGMQRRVRQRARVLAVSLVGYTNAGKSLLFNCLTAGSSYVADQLFATLDTTTRKIFIEDCGEVVLSDTVGFIQDLPHSLVAAFGATLEEVKDADLLLHVINSASLGKDMQMREVDAVLAEIGASDIPRLLVYNQIDKLGMLPEITYDAYGRINAVWLSARTGQGVGLIKRAILEHKQQYQNRYQDA